MNAVSIVTIKNKIPLFKKDEQANAIELIELEELTFELVSQKGLYEIGDKAVYIQPDYNLSDISLFESFLRPNGDEGKSMLGKVEGTPRRIRAKKFTLSKEPNGEPVYSNGILLPCSEVLKYCHENVKSVDSSLTINEINLEEALQITKYEEPEYTSKGGMKVAGAMNFPQGIYKTDETNIHNMYRAITYPITLVGTEKVDGSSITIGVTPQISEGFICSRNMRKKLTIRKVTGRRTKTFLERILFWKRPDLNIYEYMDSDDDFVKYAKPYLDNILGKGYTNLILRGELNGANMKGSGNKNNPSSKDPVNIKFFGADSVDDAGVAVKKSHQGFNAVIEDLHLPKVKEVFNQQFESFEDLLATCNAYFKDNMIEGIVVRTLDSSVSAKVMNLEYDSKK